MMDIKSFITLAPGHRIQREKGKEVNMVKSFFPRCFTFQDLRGVAADADGVEHDVRVVAVRRKLGTQLRLVRKNSGILSGNGTS
jgi:hypothetical protein